MRCSSPSQQFVFAQERRPPWKGAVIHLLAGHWPGIIVIGARAPAIGKCPRARRHCGQPAAAAQITGAVNLPLFLLEGVAILAEVFVLLIVLG